jgi:hypothetical protein
MDTLVLERNDRTFLVSDAHVLRSLEQVSEVAPDYAAQVSDWEVDTASSNPFLKWISGKYAESGKPNENKQFWTAGDLAMGEYSIRWAPLNMIHKVRQPIGFYMATKKVFADAASDQAKDTPGDFHIEALSAMWSHVFPFESTLVDQADEAGKLFYSMECRGTHLICAGDEGCGKKFDYAKKGTHCEHLQERASIRHIVNPTFRGGALIVPPVNPGWSGAKATVQDGAALMEEAARYAEATEGAYNSLRADGTDMSAVEWEQLMATIISVS